MRTGSTTASTPFATGAACQVRTRRCCTKALRRSDWLPTSARRSTPKRTSGNCQHATSAPMPRPTRRTRSRCSRASTLSSTRRARETPTGSRLTSSRWCTRCAAAAFAPIRARPSRGATIACRNATRRSPSFRKSSDAQSVCTRLHRQHGKQTPSTRTVSTIRAPPRAIRHSRPASWGGWPCIHTGCRN